MERRRKHPGGFSVLELIVTLSLVAVVGAFGVLSHQSMQPEINLSMAARQVVMDLKVTRMRAVARNVNHRILFPTGSGSYRLQHKSGSTYSDDGSPVPLPKGIVIASCTATASAIGFKPRGNAATFGTVTLQNGKGDARRVIVDIAGEMRVQ